MKIIINNQEYPDFEQEKHILKEEFGDDVEIIISRTTDKGLFIEQAKDVDAALVQYVLVDKEVIDALHKCKGYVRYGIGYDNIDDKWAAKQGKMVANVGRYCLDEVSNHALGLMLALNRNIVLSHNLILKDEYEFEKIRPVERLKHATVGIVGLGKIGKCFAEKVRPLVNRIIFYDPYVSHYNKVEKYNGLKHLFAESDYISLHLLLNKSTKRIISKDLLSMMEPNAYIINTARGEVLDQQALIDVLKNKTIAGAGLDVFETEPLPNDSPLLELDNVILTNHSAWYSEGSIKELQRTAALQLVSILKGEKPEFAVVSYGKNESISVLRKR